jgi:hypothetical protein
MNDEIGTLMQKLEDKDIELQQLLKNSNIDSSCKNLVKDDEDDFVPSYFNNPRVRFFENDIRFCI